VLVPGASYGIGAASAIALAKDGCDVAITDLRPADLAATAAAIEAGGGRAAPLSLDVCDQDSVEAGFALAVEAVDVVVPATEQAALRIPGRSLAADPARYDQRWIQRNKILLLLDGLDEVSQAHMAACIAAINVYRKEHGFAKVVICSRFEEYIAQPNQLWLNSAVKIQPLTKEQIDYYVANAESFPSPRQPPRFAI